MRLGRMRMVTRGRWGPASLSRTITLRRGWSTGRANTSAAFGRLGPTLRGWWLIPVRSTERRRAKRTTTNGASAPDSTVHEVVERNDRVPHGDQGFARAAASGPPSDTRDR